MKWNVNNIVLVFAVGVVWVYMGWRAYSYFYPSEQETMQQADDTSFSKDVELKQLQRTYSLSDLDYRDPFLGKSNRTRVHSTVHPLAQQELHRNSTSRRDRYDKRGPKSILEKESVKWPDLTYKGIVENPGTGKSAALMSVNGHDIFYLQGEELSGVRMIRIYADSSLVAYSGEERVVKR